MGDLPRDVVDALGLDVGPGLLADFKRDLLKVLRSALVCPI